MRRGSWRRGDRASGPLSYPRAPGTAARGPHRGHPRDFCPSRALPQGWIHPLRHRAAEPAFTEAV